MVKTQVLKAPLFLFQCIGLWRPMDWQSGWKSKLYDFYTLIMVLFVLTSTISEFIEILISVNDIKAIANKSFVFLTVIGVCGKATNILIKRNSLIELIVSLQEGPCRPVDDDELDIQRKYDHLTRLNTLRYAALTGFGVTSIVVGSFLQEVPKKIVPYNGWVPYDISTWWGYSMAYFHQMGAHIVGAVINVAFDTLVPGCMLHTCGQLYILRHRFYRVPKNSTSAKNSAMHKDDGNMEISESNKLAACVKHHIGIFKFAETSNNIFSGVIFLQYSLSSVVLCFSVFELSRAKPLSSEFMATFMYLACMSMQIYIFCFYGCQVTVESLKLVDAIYDMDWPSLDTTTRRSLLTIMARTSRPIEFKSGHIITLNLESFNSLIKLSYSAYNVLQQSSDN